MLTGAVRPPYIFGISLGVLLVGTLFSRMADGNTMRPAHHGCAVAVSPRTIQIGTPFATGAAEAAVLRQIAGSLADYPDATVSVAWSETRRGRWNRSRATYFPERKVLRYERLGYSSCEYNPVNPDAIARALHDSADAAFFANANLYSMGRIDIQGR